MPISATPDPTRSQTVGRMPSINHNQRIAIKIYTPPYAAYTRPAAVGCNESNQAKAARLRAAGTNSQADLPSRNHRYDK